MSYSIRIALFFLALVAAGFVSALLLNLIELAEAREWGLRVAGVLAVMYLLLLTGSVLLRRS